MTHKFDIESLVAVFPPTIVRKPYPGVYEIKGGSKMVEGQKIDLLHQLFRIFPGRLIWLKDLGKDLEEMLGKPISTGGEVRLWMAPDTISIVQLLEKLHEGGWAMFFLPNTLQHVPIPPEFLPTKPEEVRGLLHTLSASIGILSWYDDIEWLIVSGEEKS